MAATVLAPRAGAQPMAASADRGDLALVPYYTVRGQWVTGIHIVNTSEHTQVVKFRFRRATDGMDALDFNIVMSPKDVYAGFLNDDENGTIAWASTDSTCTVPATQANRLTMPPIYRVGAESGYVEIIAMGQAETEQQPIAVAARHSGATATPPLTPLNCEAVRSNFFADGTGAANPGVQNNRTTHQRAVPRATNLTIRAGGANTYADSGNVLKVSYFIRDNATGIEFGDNAVHIKDFLSAPTITNQQYGLISGDLNGFDFPDLDGSGLPRTGTTAGANPTIVRNRFNLLRRTDVLGAASIINEWSVNPANGVQMDWVVTLPGQYTMLRLPQYRASLASDGAWVPTVNSAGSPVQNPQCPRRAIPATGTAAAVSSCDYRDMPVKLTYEAYNREEFKAVDESQLVVSPQAPTETATFLPKVANVITFGGNSVLGQTDANVNANLGQPFGWVNAQLGPQSNARVCAWNSTQDAVSPGGTTVTAGQNLTAVCTTARDKVPVIGFAAWARKVAANPNASYGRIVEHSYRVLVQVPAPVPVPGAPTNLSATAGDTQVALSWTAVPGATSYTVYYSTSPITSLTAAGVTAVRNLTNTTITVTGLANGTRVYVRVTVTTAGGESVASTEASATPAAPTTVPAAPTGLNLWPGVRSVTVSWTAVPNATSYTVYYSTSPITNLTAPGVTAVRNINDTPFTVTGLANGFQYYFRVTVTTDDGESAASTQASATPNLLAVPGAPTNLSVTASKQVTLSWTTDRNTVASVIYYSTAPISSSNLSAATQRRVSSRPSNTNTIQLTDLTSNTLYYFRVAASNFVDTSPLSDQVSVIAPALTAPGAPTIERLTPGNGVVAVRWAPAVTTVTERSGDNFGYKIYYSTSPITDLTAAGVNSVGRSVGGLFSFNPIVNISLLNDTLYYFRATVSNSAGESPASAQMSTTPSLAAALPAPTVRVTAAGNGQVTLSWTPVSGRGVRYDVYYSTSQIAGSGSLGRSTRTLRAYTNMATIVLTPGQRVYFRVSVVNDAGPGPRSVQVSATP